MENHVDRFTLESQIMNCWNVVEDLKMFTDRHENSPEIMQALASIYQIKFEALWDTFEQLIAEGKVT